MLTLTVIFASQPVGLEAQFSFALLAIMGMCAIKWLGLRGIWMHVFMTLAAAIVLRYMYWRATSTIPPVSEPLNFTFGSLLFAAEIYSVGMLVLSFFIVSDPIARDEAPLTGDERDWPSVDVFVPSYNEDLDIVGQTHAAARNLDYPADRLTVWLLDDGGTDQKCHDSDPVKAREAGERRATMQRFCADLGVRYLTRARNEHAKAGNMNHALPHSSSDLILVLDADHVPTRDFLKRTVGHFQRDPRLFLVQTPHFFVNPDPVERNLETFHHMPSENEQFYSVMQRGLDKWNGTFFCGSAAILRREALLEAGGFSGESITEDCETALELHSRGWNSVYVDRAMIAGLQPESFESFIGQRSRWCQGMLQILLLKRPMFRRGLTPAQRLAYTSTPLFWLFPISRLIFMTAPALYVFCDLQIYNASLREFFAYTMFFLISNVLAQNLIYGRVRWPWVSEVYEYVQSLHLTGAIASVLLNPRKPSFKVTAKGQTLEHGHLSPLAWPFFISFAGLAATTGFALWRIFVEGVADELLLIVTAWSIFNLVIGGIALGVVTERPERRRHPRVATNAPARLHLADGTSREARLLDCSSGGTQVAIVGGPVAAGPVTSGQRARLEVLAKPDATSGYYFDVDIRSTRGLGNNTRLGLAFDDLSATDRRALATI
ncbi:MAG: UDP-forming cellulose synthase catalytic subunit, partial [Pseudomonadota bacterium]